MKGDTVQDERRKGQKKYGGKFEAQRIEKGKSNSHAAWQWQDGNEDD